MANEMELKQAQTVYQTFCEMLDERNVRYEKEPERLRIHFIMNGDGLPIDLVVLIDAERKLIRIGSKLPYTFPEARRLDGAIATSYINYDLVDGSFDYDFRDGRSFYRMTSSFRECAISKDLCAYMVACLCYTVDEYNPKLEKLSKGLMSRKDFLATCHPAK